MISVSLNDRLPAFVTKAFGSKSLVVKAGEKALLAYGIMSDTLRLKSIGLPLQMVFIKLLWRLSGRVTALVRDDKATGVNYIGDLVLRAVVKIAFIGIGLFCLNKLASMLIQRASNYVLDALVNSISREIGVLPQSVASVVRSLNTALYLSSWIAWAGFLLLF